jgi:hypothetical protein
LKKYQYASIAESQPEKSPIIVVMVGTATRYVLIAAWLNPIPNTNSFARIAKKYVMNLNVIAMTNSLTHNNVEYSITTGDLNPLTGALDSITLWSPTLATDLVFPGGWAQLLDESEDYLQGKALGYFTRHDVEDVAYEELPEFCKRNFDKFKKHFEASVN